METEGLKRAFNELLEYNHETGMFRWKERVNPACKDGWFLATPVNGYRRIQLFKKRYRAQRVAWMMKTGEWPEGEVKFHNGNGLDVRFDNLFDNTREKIEKENLSVSKILDVLEYDKDTGLFRWKKKINPACIDGWFAGRNDGKRHRTIDVFGVRYQLHQLAWFMMTGMWPESEIDHENGDGSDNRFENLRSVSHRENLMNCKLKKSNKSGFNGVRKENKKWLATITINGHQKRIGLFEKIEDAVSARESENEKQGFHKNHGVKR